MPFSHPVKRSAGGITAFALCVSLVTPTSLHTSPSTSPSRPGDPRPTLVFSQFAPGRSLHLVAYGDTRFTNPAVTGATNPRVRQWLAERIGQQHPQAILLTGDTPFHGADPLDWQVFQHETESWRKEGALQLPTIGNHEGLGGAPAGIANYLKNFPDIAGHRFYSALLGSVEVISIDFTSPSGASSFQGRWFAAQLDHIPPQVEFLLILHHLPWMADRQSQILAGLPPREAVNLRDMLEARLPKIHAKVIVFNGHIHNYERFERRGVEYVITGGGGARPYPVFYRGDGDLYRDTAFPVYHYLVLDIAEHKLHAVMWKVKDPAAATLDAEPMDQFTITSTPAGSSPAAPHRRPMSNRPPAYRSPD